MEHFVIILDYFFQKLSGRLVDRYKTSISRKREFFNPRKKSLRFKTQKRSDFFLHKLALSIAKSRVICCIKNSKTPPNTSPSAFLPNFTVFGGVLACFID